MSDIKYNIKIFADDTMIFADDTMIFSIVKNRKISVDDLNHDLDDIHQWAHQWKLEFNPDPTKQATESLSSCKKSSPIHPQITIVAKMNDQNYLGLILDLSNEKIIKAQQNIGIIKHLSIFLPHKTLDLIVKTLVRSHLDYCGRIYHIPSRQTQLGVTLNVLMGKLK